MIVATYNVNSIRMREERLLRWLSSRQPDVVCLQELKCTTEEFPLDKVRAAGYHALVHGQKSYNGVAILSRVEPTDVDVGLGRKDLDEEARFLAATIDGVRIMCAYIPAGGEDAANAKYAFKIKWLRGLIDYLQAKVDPSTPTVLCGDFNIAPEERDVALPTKWRGSAIYNDELTAIFNEMLALGLADSFRMHHDETGLYTWWDYNDLCYQRNEGTRIDHVLMPSSLEDRCYRCWVDWEERQGSKPSDHAPLMADFDWAGKRARDLASQDSQRLGRARSVAAPEDVAYGDEAAREFVRQAFPEHAGAIADDAVISIRFANGYSEPLRWNYFPAGARQWTWAGSDQWVETGAAR